MAPRSRRAHPSWRRTNGARSQALVAAARRLHAQDRGRQHARPSRCRALPAPLEITGPVGPAFPPNWGAPEQVTLDKLISWSEHAEPGVKYFSGTATYRKTLRLAGRICWRQDRRLTSTWARSL